MNAPTIVGKAPILCSDETAETVDVEMSRAADKLVTCFHLSSSARPPAEVDSEPPHSVAPQLWICPDRFIQSSKPADE